MLVLTRKVGEEIVIDGDIRVTVVAVRGNQVRLGFEAPPHIAIHRQELLCPAIERQTLKGLEAPVAVS